MCKIVKPVYGMAQPGRPTLATYPIPMARGIRLYPTLAGQQRVHVEAYYGIFLLVSARRLCTSAPTPTISAFSTNTTIRFPCTTRLYHKTPGAMEGRGRGRLARPPRHRVPIRQRHVLHFTNRRASRSYARISYPTESRLSTRRTSHPAITTYRSTWSKRCLRRPTRRWTQSFYDATRA